MTTKKLTNVLALEMVLGMKEVQGNKDLVEKLNAMKLQFDKKNKGSKDGAKKLTKAQEENELIKEKILIALTTVGAPTSIKDLQASNEEIGTALYSNQKISALLRQMVKDGIVLRTEEKRVALFSKVLSSKEVIEQVLEDIQNDEIITEVEEETKTVEEVEPSEGITEEEEQLLNEIIAE